jgi:hypothetical protein
MEVLGPMPSELLQRGTKTSEYFDETGTIMTPSYLLMKETDDLSYAPGTLIRIPALQVKPLEEVIDGEGAVFQRPTYMKKEKYQHSRLSYGAHYPLTRTAVAPQLNCCSMNGYIPEILARPAST